MWDSEINTQLSAEFVILSFPATSNSDVLWHSSLQTNKQTKPTRKQTNKQNGFASERFKPRKQSKDICL